MERDELLKKGKSLFYSEIQKRPLTIDEEIAQISFYEYFGYHNDTYLTVEIRGKSGRSMWSYPGCLADNDGENGWYYQNCCAVAEYLSDYFHCPLEIKLF